MYKSNFDHKYELNYWLSSAQGLCAESKGRIVVNNFLLRYEVLPKKEIWYQGDQLGRIFAYGRLLALGR
jgi:hypothetical protein